MTLPLKAMVACMALLNPNAPICWDAQHQLRLCVKDRCATVQSLRVEWRRHPWKQREALREIYGVRE